MVANLSFQTKKIYVPTRKKTIKEEQQATAQMHTSSILVREQGLAIRTEEALPKFLIHFY